MFHLRGRSADVVVDESTGVPTIVHWGATLGDIDPQSVSQALRLSVVIGSLDVVAPISVLPEHGSGFQGRPGLTGHRRRGTAWSPRFKPDSAELVDGRLTVVALDTVAGLRCTTRIELDDVLQVGCTITNIGSDRYLLDGVCPTVALPAHAGELLTFTGRWSREFRMTRQPWRHGTVLVENRRGRTSHENPPLVFAGSPGFGEWHGEVWGCHLAFSGNHSMVAQVLPDGRRFVQMGELLHPGEVVLEPDASYETPTLIGTYSSNGLTAASRNFHRYARSLPAFATTPRPVVLNTWEAVYFDHDPARLRQLASAAAALGVERFVLDDGWFGHRRSDKVGLGDWWVSPVVYPDGLAPLIDHVRGLGMEFGIWVEPEMVNPDSDLYRQHPEWALDTDGYPPVTGRHQYVLDLAQPGAYQHVFQQLDALLTDHDIAYVKWDMNRDHVQGSGADGAAGTHSQTLALYRLLDELSARHPSVEFESCSSGGARIDFGILRRTSRVWTSDCNDALERQWIQRGASLLIPPSVMGAHVGPPRAHTTGRRHSLAFRAMTALFGHFGLEWNVTELGDQDRDDLAQWITLYKRFRALIHHGDVIRLDEVAVGDVTGGWGYGAVAGDRSEALIAYAQLVTSISLNPPPLRILGLDADRSYHIERIALPGDIPGPGRDGPWGGDGMTVSGRQLSSHGLALPALHPESGVLVHLTAIAESSG